MDAGGTQQPLKEIESIMAKCVLLGDTGVGKTGICTRFRGGKGDDVRYVQATVGTDFAVKRLWLRNERRGLSRYLVVKLQDPPGDLGFLEIVRQLIRNCQVYFLVFSVADRRSFKHVETVWWSEVMRLVRMESISRGHVKVVLLGNKTDLRDGRQRDAGGGGDDEGFVSRLEAEQYAEAKNMVYLEVCAVDDRCNVTEVICHTINTLNQDYIWRDTTEEQRAAAGIVNLSAGAGTPAGTARAISYDNESGSITTYGTGQLGPGGSRRQGCC